MNKENITNAIIEALVEQVRMLKGELIWKDSKINDLKKEIERLKEEKNEL